MTTALPLPLEQLPTPSLLVDVDRMQANIERVAADLDQAGVRLRPHVKTSKCVEVARRQVAAGAVGLTCSTPAEVELLAGSGFHDLLWAHLPVGATKVGFAVAAARDHDLTVALDSVEAARPLSVAALAAGVDVGFLLEVNTGQARAGVEPRLAVPRAQQLRALGGLRMRGVMTHEGHLSTYGDDRDALTTAARGCGETLAAVAADIRSAGLDCETVSVGSTPGLTSSPYADGVNEARPGTYVYFDANQVKLGSASYDDCALTVLTRVVSTQRPGTAITDAGLKAMSADSLAPDRGAGVVCGADGTPLPDIEFWTANEEHGFLRGPGVADLGVGDLLRVIPNHACGTVNMWSREYAVRAGVAHEQWAISARH